MDGGKVGWGRGRLNTYRYTVTTRMTPAFEMGSDESRFNVSFIVRDKFTVQCPQSTTFEEKGEPKRVRTEVPVFISLTPYRWDNRQTVVRPDSAIRIIIVPDSHPRGSYKNDSIRFRAVGFPLG